MNRNLRDTLKKDAERKAWGGRVSMIKARPLDAWKKIYLLIKGSKSDPTPGNLWIDLFYKL